MRKVEVWPLLTPEMQDAVRKSRELYAALTDLPSHPVAAARVAYNAERRYWNAFPAEVAAVTDLDFDCERGPIKLRLYHPAPEERRPPLIYLHGGGWMVGNLDTHDRIMRLLARESGWAVLGVDYGLAPENRFPVATRQAAAVARALPQVLAGHAIEATRYAFAGDSAGANLSLSATLLLKGEGGPLPEALLLYYGGFGLKDSPSRRFYGNALDGLGEKELAFYRQCYRSKPEDDDDPLTDCLRADLAGLPPAFIAAVELDPLSDDSYALARAFELAEVPHSLKTYRGVLHGFLHYSATLPEAMEAIRDGAAFLPKVAQPAATIP